MCAASTQKCLSLPAVQCSVVILEYQVSVNHLISHYRHEPSVAIVRLGISVRVSTPFVPYFAGAGLHQP